MNIIRFPIWILMVAFAYAVGCAQHKPTPDPLAGWNLCFSQDPAELDKTIQVDYLDYIEKLPPKEKKYATYDNDFEDGKGQHAVLITIGLNGENWRHILIYDKDNKRIKTLKYVSGDSHS